MRREWAPEPLNNLFAYLNENIPKIPIVKNFQMGIRGSPLAIIDGYECCPGASSPTHYWQTDFGVQARAVAEFWLPPPFALSGSWTFATGLPDWFGFSNAKVSGQVNYGLGCFGGFEATANFVGGKFKIQSQCGPCVTVTGNGDSLARVGVAGQLRWWVNALGYSTSGLVLVEAAGNTGFSMGGKIQVGDCPASRGGAPQDQLGYSAYVCFVGFYLDVTAAFGIGGLGRVSKTWRYGPWLPFCLQSGWIPTGE